MRALPLLLLIVASPAFAGPPRLVSTERTLTLDSLVVQQSPSGNVTFTKLTGELGGGTLASDAFHVSARRVVVHFGDAGQPNDLTCDIDSPAESTERARIADDDPQQRIVAVWFTRLVPVRCHFHRSSLTGTLFVGRTVYTITRKDGGP